MFVLSEVLSGNRALHVLRRGCERQQQLFTTVLELVALWPLETSEERYISAGCSPRLKRIASSLADVWFGWLKLQVPRGVCFFWLFTTAVPSRWACYVRFLNKLVLSLDDETLSQQPSSQLHVIAFETKPAPHRDLTRTETISFHSEARVASLKLLLRKVG